MRRKTEQHTQAAHPKTEMRNKPYDSRKAKSKECITKFPDRVWEKVGRKWASRPVTREDLKDRMRVADRLMARMVPSGSRDLFALSEAENVVHPLVSRPVDREGTGS